MIRKIRMLIKLRNPDISLYLMDIYRKELNQIYSSQNLDTEELSTEEISDCRHKAGTISSVGRGCTVLTDASSDRCYIFGGDLGQLMGFFKKSDEYREESSSDEDIIYSRIHPEELVDKRLLEYEFFKFINDKDPTEKLDYKAVCRIRMKDKTDSYRYIDNTTRLVCLSPRGKIWLILCSYDFSPNQEPEEGISPAIVNSVKGEVVKLYFDSARRQILSKREKDVLKLIQEGLSSKMIADNLSISIHTVNRHRQNIISKLSVSNSIEAVMAAKAMKLL